MPGSLTESLELFWVSFPAETSYSRRDFWESFFQALFSVQHSKKGGKWTRVLRISFRNNLGTIFILEKPLKLLLV